MTDRPKILDNGTAPEWKAPPVATLVILHAQTGIQPIPVHGTVHEVSEQMVAYIRDGASDFLELINASDGRKVYLTYSCVSEYVLALVPATLEAGPRPQIALPDSSAGPRYQ